MAASTITRDTWTDDSGTTSAPFGNGTLLANTVLQNHIYARIDAMFAGAGAYATFELGGLFKVDGFGTTTFSAGGTGSQAILVRNTTAGASNNAVLTLANDNDATLGRLFGFSSTYTPSGFALASGVSLQAHGAGGLSLGTEHPNGNIRFLAAGVEFMRLSSSGGFGFGTTADPGFGNFFLNGLLSATGFGTHSFLAGGTGPNKLIIQNSTAGTGNYGLLAVGNNVTSDTLLLAAFSSTYTTTGDTVADGALVRGAGAGGLSLSTSAAQPIRFHTNATERARFLSTGELIINGTVNPSAGRVGIYADGAAQQHIVVINTNGGNAATFFYMLNSVGSVAGSISQNGATGVLYNTTSDARLKIDKGRAQDLNALRQVIIHDFTWTEDGRADRGIFAQEVVSLFPRAITRGGDEINARGGMMQPWQADYSKFVPDLIAGWQAHDTNIADLLARVAVLEKV